MPLVMFLAVYHPFGGFKMDWVNEEEMQMIRSKGEKVTVDDDETIVTGYLYNGFFYVDDVKPAKEDD